MDNSQLPLQLTGEAKQADLILYARLPAQLSGSLTDPTLAFERCVITFEGKSHRFAGHR